MRRIPAKVGRYRLGLSRRILLDRCFEHAAAPAKRLSSCLVSSRLVSSLRSLFLSLSLEVDRTDERMTSGEFTVVNLYLDSLVHSTRLRSLRMHNSRLHETAARAPQFRLT